MDENMLSWTSLWMQIVTPENKKRTNYNYNYNLI